MPQATALARFSEGNPAGYPDAFRNLIAAAYDGITHHPTLADGYRGMQLLDATLQSARDQHWVAVP